MRSSLIPAALILLLLGLVILLPKREDGGPLGGPQVLPGSAAAGVDVAAALLGLPRLELVEPPAWVLQRGGEDEVLRLLDRLSWGSHDAVRASLAGLQEHRTGLTAEVLSRLDAQGESDIILISKLVTMLSNDRGETPGVVDELVRRASSESSLVSKAALRVLGHHPSPHVLAGILERRNDSDVDVRDAARAALVNRVRMGDEEARAYVLEEIEHFIKDPDMRFLDVLREVEADERTLAVLRRVRLESHYEARVMALGALVRHGDVEAAEEVERMIAEGDETAQFNGLYMLSRAGRVLAVDSWQEIVKNKNRQAGLFLLSTLDLAIDSGHADAPLAMELIERMAQDPTHSCQVESLDLLLSYGHPWGVERTRAELMEAVGAWLAQTVSRVERVGGELGPMFADVAFQRLADPELPDIERVLLCRLLSSVDPVRGADLIVRFTMDNPQSPGISEMLSQLVRLGPHALRRLQQELDSDRGAALYVFVAAQAGDPSALPELERIATEDGRDPVLQQYALDCIVRVGDGPRADVLRRVATARGSQEVRKRAYLLFWNYL